MSDLFQQARAVADTLGHCDPLWLREKTEPDFGYVPSSGEPSGPPMVLLHGLMGALSNWDSTVPLFKKYSDPIAFHFPLLTAHRSEVKIKALAAYTWYFIKKYKLDPLPICGNSLGGHVALRLYLAAPDVVDCLILSGTSGLYEHSVDSLPVRPQHDFIRDHMGRVFKQAEFITDEAVEEVYQIVKDRKNVLNIIHAARSAKRDNLYDLLPEVKVPTLLLWGEDDEVTTMDVAETFHQRIPNSKLVTIKNCGHAPMIEHPEWFAEEVQKFLKEHSSRSK